MKADCHIHMVLDGIDWKNAIRRHVYAPDEAYIRSILALYQKLGYTHLRDGGDRWGVSALARQLAPEYGICYLTPLAPISKVGHYGGFIGEQFASLEEYTALVRNHRAQGADFIKIMISGLMDFHRFGVLSEEGLPSPEIREMVHIAHEEGFSVMAHANGARILQAAAEAGVDSVEHGAYANTEALQAMADNHVIWVPTMSTVGNLLKTQQYDRFDPTAASSLLEQFLANISAFSQMGGVLAPGTDAGAWAVPHGAETEDQWLLDAGLTPQSLEDGAEQIIKRFS